MSEPGRNGDYLLRKAQEAGITDRLELAHFMGQMQVECGGFRSMHENVNYSAARLLAVFGPYTDRKGTWHDGRNGLTTEAEAQAIVARGREGIAEALYGGAWGGRNLGNAQPGDGWKYHGRGYIQLTGRANYERVGRELGVDLVRNPDLAADHEVAARIAIHYWKDRVQARGHEHDVDAATRDINGGRNGLRERRGAVQAWERKFAAGYLDRPGVSPVPRARQPERPPILPSTQTQEGLTSQRASGRVAGHATSSSPDGPLQHGSKGPAVGRLQERLARLGYDGLDGKPLRSDNAFDDHTLAAVKKFQLDHGLEGKGIVGPKTLAALDAAERGLVTHRSHPHHALYERVLDTLQQAEAAKGLKSGPHSERIAAAVTVECLREGVQRIDRIEFNADNTLVRAVQVSAVRDEPGLNRSTDPISTRQAGHQSIAESSEQTHQVAVNLQAQQRDQQHQARPAPMH